MQVLFYGEWSNQSKKHKPFLPLIKKSCLDTKTIVTKINFIFVGTLVKGKKLLYAIQTVNA
jgi:hypothetical protein